MSLSSSTRDPAPQVGSPVGDVAAQSLELAARELSSTIAEAQRALEDFFLGRGRQGSLEQCRRLLHLARGALRIVEVHGASLVAEEMEHVCDHLLGEKGRRNHNDAIETLSRAMVELQAYLDRVMSGGRDIALVLLPLLNDLRAVRGQPVLSESGLLLLDLGPEPWRGRAPTPKTGSRGETNLQEVARQMRPAFQLALLGLIQSQDQTHNVERLQWVTMQLEAAARAEPVRQLWWVVNGVLEAIADGGLEPGVTVNRLLGQADRQIKRLIVEGEAGVAADPPIDLLNNLLYYVARARSAGERVEAIRTSFALSELLPGNAEVAAARESLSAPSIGLMQAVATAIKEDLARVKDVLDIHVRTGSGDVAALAPQLEMLEKIADILGVLGLGELRGDIQNEIRQLGVLVHDGGVVDDFVLLSIASALLKVEDSIDQQLVRMVRPVGADEGRVADDAAPDDQHRQVTAAVLRECTINIARIKEVISSALTRVGNPVLLDEIPGLLRGVTAALLMLGKERAARVVENIGSVVGERPGSDHADMDVAQADRLADAIVSLEYYMQTLAVGRSEPWYMLDNAESCLALLVPSRLPAPGDGLAVEPRTPTEDDARPDPELLEVCIEQAREELVTEPKSRMPQMDPVLRDIFLKETRGHLQTLKMFLVQAGEAPSPPRPTDGLHRACHTLLGSARMAGVKPGEALAEPMERYVRRAIAAGVPVSPVAQAALAIAMQQVERLIAQLAEDLPTDVDAVAVVSAFDVPMAELDTVAEAVSAADSGQWESMTGPVPNIVEVPVETVDPELAAMFSEEAAEILERVDELLAHWRSGDSGRMIELQRLLHTLKGGGRMAGVVPMGDMAHDLESLLERVVAGEVTASPHLLEILQRSTDALHGMRDALDAGLVPRIDADLLATLKGLLESAPADETPVDDGAVIVGEYDDEDFVEAWQAEPGPDAAVQPRPRQVAERQEFARVDADLLDDMLNGAGEISIFHAQLNRQVSSIDFNLGELSQTVMRMQDQLRALEVETERQIIHRHQTTDQDAATNFDPLELDRYSTLQQLSRALAESVGDVASLNELLRGLSSEADTLLVQQGRVTLQLQDSLIRTRMVPLQRHVTRLARLVRQVAAETGKRAELVVRGAAGELDRQILERMLPPLEHLLRNAVIHGIEAPEVRRAAHKPEAGEVSIHLRRDGSEVVIEVSDDGAGINTEVVLAKGVELGLLKPDERLSDEDEAAMEMILRPGFSTAARLTQSAGRGVGMDVVVSQVQKLGGSLRIDSRCGHGARFIVRLPCTLVITRALIVRVGEEIFALPLPTVEGIARIPHDDLLARLTDDDPRFEYAGHSFRLQHLGLFVGGSPSRLPAEDTAVPVILVRAAEHSTALITDELLGSREIVVKTLGPQIGGIPGVSGATILGDGSIVVILDVGTLVRAQRHEALPAPVIPPADERPLALVVDDSITVRRVTQRLLERNGMRAITAKDGMEAINALAESRPGIILLDIEMPRMDGYEFATHVRNNPRVADVPIIMITSRSSEKHRARAIEVGVNDYLSKPYQESQLLAAITPLVRPATHD